MRFVNAQKLIYSSLMHYVRISVVYRIVRLKIKHHQNTFWPQKNPHFTYCCLFFKMKFKRKRKLLLCAIPHSPTTTKIILQLINAFDRPPPIIETSYEHFSLPFSRYLCLLYVFFFAPSTLCSLHTCKTQTSVTVQDDQWT